MLLKIEDVNTNIISILGDSRLLVTINCYSDFFMLRRVSFLHYSEPFLHYSETFHFRSEGSFNLSTISSLD